MKTPAFPVLLTTAYVIVKSTPLTEASVGSDSSGKIAECTTPGPSPFDWSHPIAEPPLLPPLMQFDSSRRVIEWFPVRALGVIVKLTAFKTFGSVLTCTSHVLN